jgi:allophanate hydrolase
MTTPGNILRIRDPGPATSVQDRGRHQMRRLGVPVAGTLAPDWLHLANALLGNPPDLAGLEFRMVGPRFTIEAEAVRLIVGGPAVMRIDGADGRRDVRPWTATMAHLGDTVTVGRVQTGTTAVLAVSGGIDTPPILGARATYARAALGGHHGRLLQVGDAVPVGPQVDGPLLALAKMPDDPGGPIRLVAGPQDDHFRPSALAALCAQEFCVTNSVDRMGMRLEGPLLHHLDPSRAEIVSDGIVPGAMQVPGNGQPIVLLADGQTVGGYPKIATIISADLPRLARRAPGDRIRFAMVDVAEAEAAARRMHADLQRAVSMARPVGPDGGLDLRRLYEDNLISGVVDSYNPDPAD